MLRMSVDADSGKETSLASKLPDKIMHRTPYFYWLNSSLSSCELSWWALYFMISLGPVTPGNVTKLLKECRSSVKNGIGMHDENLLLENHI